MTAKTRKPTRASSATEWKKKAAGELIDLPSGLTMRVRKIGIQALMKTGIMPNSLMGIVQSSLDKGKGRPGMDEAAVMELIGDEKKVREIGEFMDKMVIAVAMEPKIHPMPAVVDGVEAARDDDLVYVDEVAEEDKMFLFQVVTGGTTDVESFREELGSTMDDIRGRQDVELPAE
jgi:hypothetical protein